MGRQRLDEKAPKQVRWASRVVSAVGVAAVLALGMAAEASAIPVLTQQTGTAPVKYLIVPAGNPDDVTLFNIAQATLGSGDRYPEIFALNKGNAMPEGGTFDDPTQIEAGQVLQLPPDASGQGVQYGPLPSASAAPSPAPPSAPSSLPAQAAPTSAPHTPAPVSQAPAAQASTGGEAASPVTGWALWASLGALLLATAGFFLVRFRGRRKETVAVKTPRKATEKTATATVPAVPPMTPPHGFAHPALPLPLPPPLAAPGLAEPAFSAEAPTLALPPQFDRPQASVPAAGHAAVGPPPAPVVVAQAAQAATRAAVAPSVPAEPPEPSFLDAVAPEPTVTLPSPNSVLGRTAPDAVVAAAAEPEPQAGELFFAPFSDGKSAVASLVPVPAPASEQVPEGEDDAAGSFLPGAVSHEVAFDNDRLHVHLEGAARSGGSTDLMHRHIGWTALPQIVPSGGAFVWLGIADQGCLFVDLAAIPGLLALGGKAGPSARLANSLVLQAAGLDDQHRPRILIAGAVAPQVGPGPGIHRFRTLGEIANARAAGIAAASPGATFELIVATAAELAVPGALEQLRAASGIQVALLSVGELPDAEWRITALTGDDGAANPLPPRQLSNLR